MAKQQSDLTWTIIDVDTLDAVSKRMYDAYKEQYRAAKQAKEAFETSVRDRAKLPQGKRMVFGYNFGRLSVAIADAEDKAPAKAKGSVNLSEFLKGADFHGHRR